MFVILLHAAHTLLRMAAGLQVFPLALFTAVPARATTATDGKRRLIVGVLKTADIAFPSNSLSNSGALVFVAFPVLSLAFLGTVTRLTPCTKPKMRFFETDLLFTTNTRPLFYSSSSPRIDRGERGSEGRRRDTRQISSHISVRVLECVAYL